MAQDRTADQWRAGRADLPQETQPEQADLPARLERLPAGHPSSLYRDDGARKPSPPDLSEYQSPSQTKLSYPRPITHGPPLTAPGTGRATNSAQKGPS